jgi:hypothetical protein
MTNNLIDTCFLYGDKFFAIFIDDHFILGPIVHDQPNARMRLFYDV